MKCNLFYFCINKKHKNIQFSFAYAYDVWKLKTNNAMEKNERCENFFVIKMPKCTDYTYYDILQLKCNSEL